MPDSRLDRPGLLRRGLRAIQAAVAVVLLVLVAALLAGSVPSLFGCESYVVMSGSMEPTLRVGDLAVVAPVAPADLRVGDVISYRTPKRPDVVVTHRLTAIGVNDAGRTVFETRGDANDSADQIEIDPRGVVGRLVYAVPKVGYLVDFAKRPLGKILLLGVPAALLAADAVLGRRRRAGARGGQDAVELLVRRAWVAQRNGGTETALALLDQALALDPAAEDAWLLKAECFEQAEARLTCLRDAVRKNPRSRSLRLAMDETAKSLASSRPPLAARQSVTVPPTGRHGYF